MHLWSSPERTDKYGLHLKLGYSKQPWAYLSADIGHIHLQEGNFTGAWRVWNAMLDNGSPSVATFEEFQTGPMPKTMWGGIPDCWYTAELVNLFRDSLVLELPERRALQLFHATPRAWLAHPAGVSIANATTKFGCRVSSAWAGSTGTVELDCHAAADPIDTVRLVTGQDAGWAGLKRCLGRVRVSVSTVANGGVDGGGGGGDGDVGDAAMVPLVECSDGGSVVVLHRPNGGWQHRYDVTVAL